MGTRRAACTTPWCRKPMLFGDSSQYVQCRKCEGPVTPVSELRNVVAAGTSSEEVDWLYFAASFLEKSGALGVGRARTANRAIDGISNYVHCVVLFRWFDRYGVNPQGEVKKLSEMKLDEPLSLTMISDYAFGIRMEHLDVEGYGCNWTAIRYLRGAITAVGRTNGKTIEDGIALVPLAAKDDSWPWNSASLVSKACVGREIFARRLALETMKHLKLCGGEYKKRSSYDAGVWSQLESANPSDRLNVLEFPSTCDLDLAALANLLRRTILLMDASPPFIDNVFVPFLRKPQDCCDRNGKKRPPVVLAWSSQAHLTRVAMVSTANDRDIWPIRLPREWFESVWGAKDKTETETLLRQYLEFDGCGGCLVASGKYFKPEYLHRYVEAFEKEASSRTGVVTSFEAEFGEDTDTLLSDSIQYHIMTAAVGDRLWRCVQCERVCSTIGPKKCRGCNLDSHLRRQCADGDVEYKNGDHTQTPAPNSWCFTKRKHFWNGLEYDNAPQMFEVLYTLRGGQVIQEPVTWFSGESDPSLNSDMSQLTRDMVKKYQLEGIQEMALTHAIESQVEQKTHAFFFPQHRLEHLQKSLPALAMNLLSDECAVSPKGVPTGHQKLLDIDSILQDAHEKYAKYVATNVAIRYRLVQEPSPELEALDDKIEELQQVKDEVTFEALDQALQGCDMAERWRRLGSRMELFRFGGLYYHWAFRHNYYRTPQHFKLPLLGDVKFVMNEAVNAVEVCVFGDHLDVSENVDTVCFLMSDPENGPAAFEYKCSKE